ncbi:MAG: LapA family protein [Mycobacterium sp.]
MRHSPVDHDRTVDRRMDESVQDAARTPGLVVVGAAALGFVVCVATFALGKAGAGVAAAIVAMLAFGAGLSWLAMDRRRIRQAEREWVISHPAR